MEGWDQRRATQSDETQTQAGQERDGGKCPRRADYMNAKYVGQIHVKLEVCNHCFTRKNSKKILQKKLKEVMESYSQ